MRHPWFPFLVLCALPLGAQNVGYVVDNGLGEVKVVNLTQRRVTATIPSGAESAELLILPGNRTGFVSNQAEGTVAVLDLANNTRLATIPAGDAPGSLIASPDGRFVYVANEDSNDVAVIDTAAMAVIAKIAVEATPVAVNLSPNGRFLYVVNRDAEPAGTVSVIDTNRLRVIQELEVGLRPSQFALSPNLATAYVVNSGSDNVSVVDLARNQVTATIAVGQGPASVAFSTDGRFLYVLNRNSNNLSVVDTQQNAAVAQIPVGAQPADMVVTFDSKFGYVSNQGSNSVSVLDLTTRRAEATLATGNAPFDLMLDPNEDFLYVTNLNSQSLTVIDVNTDRVAATIPLGGVPIQFTQLNAPTLLEIAPNPAAAGSRITLNGEGFLATSLVGFRSNSPLLTSVPGTWLDSQGLQVTIPSSVRGSSAVVFAINPDGSSSEELTLGIGTASPMIFSGGVVEGAGFQRAPYPISGNDIVSAFGGFPGLATAQAPAFPLPATLGNSRLTFNGVPAALISTSAEAGQINAVAPIRLAAQSSVRVAVTIQNQTSAVETVNVVPAAPGIFVIFPLGIGACKHGTRPADLVTASDPARRGEIITMYLTGLGATTPAPLDGEPAPGDVESATPQPWPAVLVGGAPARVTFSGLAPGFSGLYQINFEVPASAPAGNDVGMNVSTGSFTSNSARLPIQ